MHTVFSENHHWFLSGKEGYLPDGQLIGRMRVLASESKADGLGCICAPSGAGRTLRSLRAMLGRISQEERCAALQKAADAAPFFEAAAFSRPSKSRCELPAMQGEARILRIAREILLCSDGRPSAQRLEDALRAFSDARALRTEELARMPDAIRTESLRLFAAAAESAMRIQNARDAARLWTEGRGPMHSGSVFLEHAIFLCREGDLPARHAELERALEAEEGGAHGVIARAHEKQARLCMWLENLPGAMRMPDAIDPENLLLISSAARRLASLPAYTDCDEASRSAIRARIGEIAHAAKVDEDAVVRTAIDLSREFSNNMPGAHAEPSGKKDSIYADAYSETDDLRAEPAYYWADDTGRGFLLARLGRADVRMKKLVPDPKGLLIISVTAAFSLCLYIFLHARGLPSVFCGLIGCWTAAWQLLCAVAPRLYPPKTLLRLQLKHVPDNMRTLVVIPAILPNSQRAQELVAQMETLAAGERDENVEFCLLGDFPDAPAQHISGDEAILFTAREAIDRANERLGAHRLHYLHRERAWNEPSGRWMGHERKRGALHALGALLLRGENAFDAEGSDANALTGRFRYIITLDADARPYPGALRMLIGAIAHPLNRLSGVHILQPRMAQSAAGSPNPFARFLSGGAGVSGYGGGVSEIYQDLCAQGGFAGKGIYDIAAFDQLAAHALPDNAILSHDLIEGFLAGSAFAGDIVFLDHFPGSLSAYFKRLHRWTRGDWQLLPFLRGRTPLQKFRMLDNLRASLAPLSALALIWLGLAFGSRAALLLALSMYFLGALLAPGRLRSLPVALAHFSVLPNDALCRTDAALRALYRTFCSHRGMLDWVCAADAERQAGKTSAWPRFAAAFLCVLFSLAGDTAALGFLFALLFLVGASILESTEKEPETPRMDDEQRAMVEQLARETWQYFAKYTCESGFPPDNVQFDPPKGAADRTSPTNIGLYMASCIAAQKLGLIESSEMLSRLQKTAESIEKSEKWRGQMYNWYDPVSCAPLYPRYVSSVDSGNLAACLLLCAQAVRETDAALSGRLENIACEMDLSALYDPVRRLFYIGYDAERGALSSSHYDLLASEARILSYTAIMLGQVPPEHWRRLSRACSYLPQGAALASWSGTMFEYLMPELFLPAPKHTLLGEACRLCVLQQERSAVDGLWGVSESGYYAFDARRNFQYRAFGVREMMLRDERTGMVISPYSAALALLIEPVKAAENLQNMYNRNFTTPCGLAEAIDFSPERLGAKKYAQVSSAMAHHMGMTLLSCANVLTGGEVRDCFALRPDARAFLPLLEESPVRPPLFRRENPRQTGAQRVAPARCAQQSRDGKRGLTPPDGHMLTGGGSSLYISADGSACLHASGLRVNRFLSDSLPGGGFYTHISVPEGGYASLTGGRTHFAPGSASFHTHAGDINITEEFFLSPEDGALLRLVTLRSRADRALRVEIRDIAALSLCRDAEADEHPAFHNLFLECSYPDAESALPEKPQGRVLRILRRPREAGAEVIALDYSISGLENGDALELCADRRGMLLRGADPACAENVFASPFMPTPPGAGLSPVQGARITLTVPARGERTLGFASFVSRAPHEKLLPGVDRYLETEALIRAQKLSDVSSRALFRLHSLSAHKAALFGRAASLCVYSMPGQAGISASKEALWPLGISGDRPVLTAIVHGDIRHAAQILQLHAYLCAMGLQTDAVLICSEEHGYTQPMHDRLTALIDELRLQGEGAMLFTRGDLSPETLSALEGLSALYLQDGETLENLFSSPDFWPESIKPAPQTKELVSLMPEDKNYGHFTDDGCAYRIGLPAGASTPHAWSNILAGKSMGALVTETGGGFLWHRNSRNERLTPFRNDPLCEGAPVLIGILDENAQYHALMPRSVSLPAEVIVRQGESEIILQNGGVRARIIRYTHPDLPAHAFLIHLENESGAKNIRLRAKCDFLMGVHPADRRAVRIETQNDMLIATGAADFASCLRLPGAKYAGSWLETAISLAPDTKACIPLIISAADTPDEAVRIAENFDAEKGLGETRAFWADLLGRVRFDTGDAVADAILCRWAPYQAIAARFLGRAGLYQSGGAYGFRDQLQDALCLCPVAPEWTRGHILLCAAHQFIEGDVQHWWHPPRRGVRTRIRDDSLFLPYVTAQYVLETGDRSILAENVPYLAGEALAENEHDRYFEADVSDIAEPLEEHCMRAVRRVFSMAGEHGLPLMGCGDWNDGMDRVGAKGKGESVWLAQFLCVVARDFAEICPRYADELGAISQTMLENIELQAWDGDRYIRAFRDDGTPLGSKSTQNGCKIDALCQSWAVLAGCSSERVKIAMDTLWEHLFDEKEQILRLLDPPFDGNIADTGYIAAYPPGIRENGGQYTHAACWALLAFAKTGDRKRAWQLLRALLPPNHADTREKADLYRVEPYAVAADISACGTHYAGRGGWTWYTGAAGWLFRAFLTGVAGYERRGDRIRLCALLDEGMDEMRVVIRHGNSIYTLISARGETACNWAELIDDGKMHELRFRAR